MALRWRLAYRLGFTPWERVGEAGTRQLAEVVARAQPVPGRALDVGCGSGRHALTLARLGWDVTGVDVVPEAIERARRRAADADVTATFLRADVGALPAVVDQRFRLVVDVGCFHVLDDATRDRYAEAVDAVTAPGSTLVMAAFQPNHPLRLGPRGTSTADVVRRFPLWTLQDEEPARVSLPRVLRHLSPRLLTLRRER